MIGRNLNAEGNRIKNRILGLGLIFIVLQISIQGQSQEIKTNYRDSRWGMTQQQVKAIEKSEFVQTQRNDDSGLDLLVFKGKAKDLDCVIAYYFAEDKLVEGRYVFLDQHSNRNLFINDFEEVKESLIAEHGKPLTDDIFWNNDLYKNVPEDWALAISVGHLAYKTMWSTPDTRVILLLDGDNNEISLALDYQSASPDHKKLIRKQAKEGSQAQKNYSDAEKVIKAMKDMNKIATYVVDYLTDHEVFAKQDGPYTENSEFYEALVPYVPKGENLPLKDAWGNDYLVYCGTAADGKYGISGCESDDFIIVSLGADGKPETWRHDPSNPKLGLFNFLSANDYNKDLVNWNGSWIRAPRPKDK